MKTNYHLNENSKPLRNPRFFVAAVYDRRGISGKTSIIGAQKVPLLELLRGLKFWQLLASLMFAGTTIAPAQTNTSARRLDWSVAGHFRHRDHQPATIIFPGHRRGAGGRYLLFTRPPIQDPHRRPASRQPRCESVAPVHWSKTEPANETAAVHIFQITGSYGTGGNDITAFWVDSGRYSNLKYVKTIAIGGTGQERSLGANNSIMVEIDQSSGLERSIVFTRDSAGFLGSVTRVPWVEG